MLGGPTICPSTSEDQRLSSGSGIRLVRVGGCLYHVELGECFAAHSIGLM
jgi:hypothetical protein